MKRIELDELVDAPETLPLSDAERAILDDRLDAHYTKPSDSSSWAEVRARIIAAFKGAPG
jgi:putative addiction module component (TIGR02574 family)